jgi:hypothetical protein
MRHFLYNDQGQPISLNQIKKSRKLADSDVDKLHNRIRMLQLEEDRALKKIEETRRKARNIMEVRLNKSSKLKNPRSLTPDDNRALIFQERKEEHKRVLNERLSLLLQRR